MLLAQGLGLPRGSQCQGEGSCSAAKSRNRANILASPPPLQRLQSQGTEDYEQLGLQRPAEASAACHPPCRVGKEFFLGQMSEALHQSGLPRNLSVLYVTLHEDFPIIFTFTAGTYKSSKIRFQSTASGSSYKAVQTPLLHRNWQLCPSGQHPFVRPLQQPFRS